MQVTTFVPEICKSPAPASPDPSVAQVSRNPDAALLGGDAQTHDPAPLGDAAVADESELFEQALWPGMQVGAALLATPDGG